MKSILQSLENIAATSGNAKTVLLAKALEDSDLLWAVKRALDPMITYGVGKKTLAAAVKGEKHGDLPMVRDNAEDILRMLQARMVTGSIATEMLRKTFKTYDADSWEMLTRIINKDLRAGFTAKTVNEARGCAEIEVFEVNLAHPYKEKHIKSWPVKSEIKFDGVRTICIADLAAETAVFLSRTGKEFHTFRSLAGDVIKLLKAGLRARGRVVLDGEVITGDFLKTVSEVRRRDFDAKDAMFNVFEVMSEEEFKTGCRLAEEKRRERAEKLFSVAAHALGQNEFEALSVSLIEQDVLHSHEEVMAKFKERFDQGFEGIIVKPTYGFYERKRSYGYLKLKDTVETAGEMDLKITGVYEGEGKYQGMAGGVTVDFNGVAVNVGGGFTDLQRAEIWADYTDSLVTLSQIVYDEATDAMITTNKVIKPTKNTVIGRVVEIAYHEILPSGSVRHPRFRRFRDLLEHGEKV